MNRLLQYLRRRSFERDLQEEMDAHFDEKLEELANSGLNAPQARARAARDFGNRTRIAEISREQWASISLQEIGQDLRYAARVLRGSPAFALVAILSLAIGIGANTVVFSALDHILLRSLPYPDADLLYSIQVRSATHGAEPMQASAGDFYEWRAQSRSFVSMAAYASWPLNLTNVNEPRRLDSQLVSANFFSTLGVNAQIGRTFLPDEEQEGAPPVLVLSHRLWQDMGAAPEIIGRQVNLNGSSATIVGVMPADFAFPSRGTDAWVPLALSAQNRASHEGGWLRVVARSAKRDGTKSAATEMDLISHRLARAFPATNAERSAVPVPLRDEIVGKTRPLLLVLEAVATVLLLIACTNLTSLLLARSASRSREIAVRMALGAGRARIVRQLLVECMLLATLGGALGIVLAMAGIRLVRTFGSDMVPRASEIALSGHVVAFSVIITAVTVLIMGLAPALESTRADLRTQINSGARGTARQVERKRGLLLAFQVGLASILLVCAGLLSESIFRLLSTSPGFRTDHVLTLRIRLSPAQYPTSRAQAGLFAELEDRVQRLPGVLAAGEISETPLKGNNPTFEFVADGVTRNSNQPLIQAGLRAMSTSYLKAAAIPLISGRNFLAEDEADRSPVAIVNNAMARKVWPGVDPLGRRIRFKDEQRWITVVGVAADTKQNGLDAEEGSVIYIPYGQKTQVWLAWTTLFVRTSGEPMEFVPAIRSVVRLLDKNQPLAEIETLDGVLGRSTAVRRFTAAMIALGAGIALLIAIVGVYGLLVYSVARRMPELGIRLTLGASPQHLSWLLLRQAMFRVFGGISFGLIFVWWLAQWLQTLLFDVRPHDPRVFAGVAALLFLASLAVMLVPAQRIWKIDPAKALRTE